MYGLALSCRATGKHGNAGTETETGTETGKHGNSLSDRARRCNMDNIYTREHAGHVWGERERVVPVEQITD